MIGETVSHYRVLPRKSAVVGWGWSTRRLKTPALEALLWRSNFCPDEDRPRQLPVLERFRRAKHARLRLSIDPNICTIYDVGEEGRPGVSCDGVSSKGMYNKHRIDGKPLAIDFLLDLGIQIADALDAAHAKSIVHRVYQARRTSLLQKPPGEAAGFFGLAKV